MGLLEAMLTTFVNETVLNKIVNQHLCSSLDELWKLCQTSFSIDSKHDMSGLSSESNFLRDKGRYLRNNSLACINYYHSIPKPNNGSYADTLQLHHKLYTG